MHGFRSTFSDWAAEQTNFPRELAEAALAHTVADRTEAAYRRGDLFEKRRSLMADWAAFCQTEPSAVGQSLQRQAQRHPKRPVKTQQLRKGQLVLARSPYLLARMTVSFSLMIKDIAKVAGLPLRVLGYSTISKEAIPHRGPGSV